MLKVRSYKSVMDIAHKAGEELVYELGERSPFSSGELLDSIQYDISGDGGNFTINIYMVEWGIYQDEGVNGVQNNWGSRFSFKDKMPNPKSLDSWIVRTGIAPRDNKGRFISRKSMRFLIARSIFNKGIRPKNWIDPNGELDEKTDEISIQIYESIWDDFEDEVKSKNKRY